MIRSTTTGVLKNYRYNLQRSTLTRNKAQNTVLTQRNFNTFAEDPATAARCFQQRRAFLRTNSQYAVGESVVRKYDVAWATLESVVQDVDNRKSDSALSEIVYGSNSPTGAGRPALGDSLVQMAEGIIQSMNTRYGDNYVFAGADGLNVPFEWATNADGTKSLTYRGINVDAGTAAVDTTQEVGQDGAAGTGFYALADGSGTIAVADYEAAQEELAKLDYLSYDEKKFADIGLGLQEENGELIKSSAFNVALQGINFLGYGVDEDGDPKNIASIMHRMGSILQNCSEENGTFLNEAEETEFKRLFKKFEAAADTLSRKHVELDTEAEFLQSNQIQLEANAYTMQEQFLGIEDVDLAEAITSYSWAQFCYNSALKVGNSILSESLMDYLRL